LSGFDDQGDLEQIIYAIARAPDVSEICIIQRHRPKLATNTRTKIIHTTDRRSPWEFFKNINIFIGGDGVMISEAIAQGIPSVSLTSPERTSKNHWLIKSGALQVLLRNPFDASKLTKILSDKKGLEKMHDAAVKIEGPKRAEKLPQDVFHLCFG